MSLWDRLGRSRKRAEAEPDADAMLATRDVAAGRAGSPALKAPQVRPVYGSRNLPRPALAGDAPYPARPAAKGRSPLDDLALTGEERKLADALFGEPPAAEPEPAPRPAPRPAIVVPKKKMDRGDLTIGALGITLGLTCALFPWYIFFNQEKFGVREFTFDGTRGATPPSSIAYQPQLVGGHFKADELPRMDLDFFPTATLPGEDEQVQAVPASEQPFPSDLVTFRLVHVANGRAMIQDDDGLWIVQPGSRLPDASKVASIEKREGKWVLVTSHDKVVSLEQ